MKQVIRSPKSQNIHKMKEYPNFLFVYPFKHEYVPFYDMTNVAPISIKRSRGRDSRAFWQTKDFDEFRKQIDHEFIKIYNHLDKGAIVVIPEDSISKDKKIIFKDKAPRLHEYLENKIQKMIDTYGLYDTFEL